jgi:hypothetical protein
MDCCNRITHTPSLPATNCCGTITQSSQLQKTVDLICRLALGAFAALTAPISFGISLGVGLLIGSVYAITRIQQNLPMFPDGESKPVCAQGYMDFLSGMKFPPLVGTLATTAFIAAHTRHDPAFYVPFCGLFIGFWTGRELAIHLSTHDYVQINQQQS